MEELENMRFPNEMRTIRDFQDCIAYVFKLANYTGVDLQEAYLKKMRKNLDRTWGPPQA